MLPNTHDAIVDDWTTNAQNHDDENYNFLRSLKRRSSKKVDRIARQLNREVFQIVDCTRCANCCRKLRPAFTDEDIDRIANYLHRTKEQFICQIGSDASSIGHVADAASVGTDKEDLAVTFIVCKPPSHRWVSL